MILAIDQGTTGTTCLVFDREGRIAGAPTREFEQHFPRPAGSSTTPNEIWEVTRGVCGAGDRRRGDPGRRPGRDRDHEPARDGRRLGPRDGRARPPRARLAGPPHGGALRRAAGGRARGAGSRADRARHRPLLLGHEDRVASAERRGGARRRLRDDRLVARLQAHRPPRHRLLERLADDAVRHPRAALGRRALRAAGGGSSRRCPSRSRRPRSTAPPAPSAARSRWRGSPATSRRRCSARPATGRDGQEHLRDRQLRPAQHRRRRARARRGAADHRRLGARDANRLRARGGGVHHRRRRAMAARRARDHRRGRRDARRWRRRSTPTTASTSCRR